MFVHFRETPYGLAMSVVENRRENGKVRHEHVLSLGSIETPPSVAARIEFWRELHERLAELSNRLDAETRGKVLGAVHGSPWSPLTNNAMPSDDHRLLKSRRFGRSHRRHVRSRANRTLGRSTNGRI
jgi:hypothetical protein